MGKVVWGFTSSIDGFIAGPEHDMTWLASLEHSDEGDAVNERLAAAVGAILSGGAGHRAALAQAEIRDDLTAEAYGGAWSGVEYILTHRPEEIERTPSQIPISCNVEEAIRIGRQAAGDLDLQIISADIARQALEKDLIDELQVFVAPVFLGDGVRIFDVPGGRRLDWELVSPIEGAEKSFGRTYRPRLSAAR